MNNGNTPDQIRGYELLLRHKGEENRFPASLFKEYIYDNDTNRIFFNWLVREVKKLIEAKPDQQFSFNIDPQQLLYASTIEGLEELLDYKEHVMIEITEAIPSKRYFEQYYNNSLLEPIKQVYERGFRIAIDDVSSGMNSFNMVRAYGQYISRIKLSLLQLRDTNDSLIKKTIMLWQSMAEDSNIDVIIEGVDNTETSDWLIDNSLELQQGYLLGKPVEIE